MKSEYNLIIPIRTFVLLALLFTGFNSCMKPGIEKKKVVYVNSYHRGFPPSDQITEGVYEKLPTDSFEILAYFIDSKRNPSEEYIKGRTADQYDLSGCNITGILELLPVPELADDFASWKSVFEEANQSHDIIYLQTRGAIKGWDHDDALSYVGNTILKTANMEQS